MARDYVDIGPAPAEEDCAQVGQPDYAERSRMECRRFIILIRAAFGLEPEGARLAIKANPHDFGTYHEVVCWYDPERPEAAAYAWSTEGAPSRWLYQGVDYSQGRFDRDAA